MYEKLKNEAKIATNKRSYEIYMKVNKEIDNAEKSIHKSMTMGEKSWVVFYEDYVHLLDARY